MKKDRKDTIKLVGILLLASLILYIINFLLFRDLHHIGMFFTEDLAFIPIEVLVTVMIIEKALERREKKNKIRKINLLIEVFFEEVGNELLTAIASRDKGCHKISCLLPKDHGKISDSYKEIKEAIENYNCSLKLDENDIDHIYEILCENKEGLIRFIENPYLVEHDIFTDLLQSSIHLYSEIKVRKKNGKLSETDISHLNVDILRMYKYLSKEWLVYIQYIEKEYPFLYTFALDHAPFSREE